MYKNKLHKRPQWKTKQKTVRISFNRRVSPFVIYFEHSLKVFKETRFDFKDLPTLI